MAGQLDNCKNCNTLTIDSYCQHCGQRSSVHKVTFRETFHDLADNLFSLSAPLALTINYLIINPGQLFREYLSGQRRKYYKPISLFLLTTLLYIFIRWLIDFNILGQIIGDPTDNPTIDVAMLDQARAYMFKNINNLLFIFVITLALILKAFFFKKYMLSEYLAVSFYLASFYTLITTVNLFYIKYINPNIQYIAVLVMWVYFVYAMVSFFEHRKWMAAIKAFFAYIISYILYVFLAFYFSYIIVWLKQS